MYYPEMALAEAASDYLNSSTEWLYEKYKRLLLVGWLDKDYPFRTCENNPIDIASFFQHCRYEINRTMGCHFCDFCPPVALEDIWQYPKPFFYEGASATLGSGLILVNAPGSDTAFLAPSLILHYVAEHNYRPPDEFLASIAQSDPQAGHRLESELWLQAFGSEIHEQWLETYRED